VNNQHVTPDEIDQLLATLPRHAPSHGFADRVMAEVPVFVPWYVTAEDTLRRYTPRSRRGRVAAFSVASLVGSLLTAAMVWAATRPDLVLFGIEVAESRVREMVVRAGTDLVVALFGNEAGAVVSRAGGLGLLAAGLVFLTATIGTLAGLRVIAVSASRRRS
jgi:hypothetical protein